MKKKGMFTGFFTIFSFTAKQSMKGKGFKTAGILIGLFVFLLFFAVPVIMANVQKSDSETDDYGMEEKPLEDYEPEEIPDAFLVLDTGTFDTSLFEEFTKLWGEGVFAVEYSDMQITDENYGRLFEEYKETYKRPVALKAERKKGELVFTAITKQASYCALPEELYYCDSLSACRIAKGSVFVNLFLQVFAVFSFSHF